MENTENRVRAAARRFKGFGTQQTRLIIVRTVRLEASCSRIVHCRGCCGKIGRGMPRSWLDLYPTIINRVLKQTKVRARIESELACHGVSTGSGSDRVRIVRISSFAISYDPVATAPGTDLIIKERIMSTSRRKFLKLSALAGGSVGLGLVPAMSALSSSAGSSGKARKPLRILILGGTGFTGPFQVKYALSRRHKVTVFNRGKTHPGELPKEAEQLIGDRNGQLEALKGKQWDVCIDNPTTLPAWVRDAAQILKGNVERYIFTSTISVYADTSTGPDENAPLAKYEGANAFKETLEAMKASGYKTYGPLKALSEQETQKWFPGKSLIIRPGLIVGPRDETDRFTYWPVRIDRGGEVLAPGNPSDPVQFIDGRDLAEWTIRMAENGETGIYNATGPGKEIGVGGKLEGIKTALNSSATFN